MAIMLSLAVITSGRVRAVCLGLAVGLGAHYLRDTATSTAGVPLLWPIDTTGFTLVYRLYAASMLLAILLSLATSIAARHKQRGPGQ
jgi:membrane-bound metal-dependent hydrolase YbcI (DUF457 family)